MKIAALSRSYPGESHNGDGYFLARLDSDRTRVVSKPDEPEATVSPEVMELGENDAVLLAVVDGVGHGIEAAATTARVLDCLGTCYRLDLESLLRECHRAAVQSRGATIGLALLNLPDAQIQFIGVGDISMQILTCASPEMSLKTLVNNNGTVGYTVPQRLLTATCEFSPGDMLFLSSDGIKPSLDIAQVETLNHLEVEAVVSSLVASHGSDRDDATLVVAR